MLISYDWVKDFANIKVSPENLAHKLTMAGIEVSSIKKVKSDYIYDAEITPNRPDLLSIIGLAREASCITDSKLKIPKVESFSKNINKNIDVDIKAARACLRYNAALIKKAKIKVSPQDVTRRLNALEVRPVNNVVDATNYILFETGQPLHAFDYDKIEGKKIIVRWAKKGESILAIDGNEYKLDDNILVIADEKKPIAIAGIMGGVETEINIETENILLECAHFDPVIIRKASRKLGLSSDSSYRFERGICIEDIPKVAQKAAHFINGVSGSKISDNVDILKTKLKEKAVSLRKSQLERILGFSMPMPKIKKILKGLGFELVFSSKDKLNIKIPSFRKDISREIDIIEEIARIYGYDQIPSSFAEVTPKKIEKYSYFPKINEQHRRQIIQKIKDILTSSNLYETINYSLVNEEDLKKFKFDGNKLIKIKNPLSEEQAVMRPSLILGLVKTVAWNFKRQVDDIPIFEIGRTMTLESGKIKEKENIGIALCGKKFLNDWQIKSKTFNFFDLKGIIEKILDSFNINYKIEESVCDYMTSSQTAKVVVNKNKIAELGKIKDDLLDYFDIENEVFAAELDLNKIFSFIKTDFKIKSIPKFPHIKRDLAIVVKEDLESKVIREEIEKIGQPLIKEVELFDVYTGKQIPQGYKSLAYSIKYQSQSRTLTDEEVDQIQEEIHRSLVENLKAQIR